MFNIQWPVVLHLETKDYKGVGHWFTITFNKNDLASLRHEIVYPRQASTEELASRTYTVHNILPCFKVLAGQTAKSLNYPTKQQKTMINKWIKRLHAEAHSSCLDFSHLWSLLGKFHLDDLVTNDQAPQLVKDLLNKQLPPGYKTLLLDVARSPLKGNSVAGFSRPLIFDRVAEIVKKSSKYVWLSSTLATLYLRFMDGLDKENPEYGQLLTGIKSALGSLRSTKDRIMYMRVLSAMQSCSHLLFNTQDLTTSAFLAHVNKWFKTLSRLGELKVVKNLLRSEGFVLGIRTNSKEFIARVMIHLSDGAVCPYGMDPALLKPITSCGLREAIRNAGFNHRATADYNRRTTLAKLEDFPMPNHILDPKKDVELEAIRIKTAYHMVETGIELRHCVGNYASKDSSYLFFKKNQCCAMVYPPTWQVVQCYDFNNSTTAASKAFEKWLVANKPEAIMERTNLPVLSMMA